MSGWWDRPLGQLLAELGLDGIPERPFPHDGWSGASFTILERAPGERFVLKRDSLARDWIARATLDDGGREASLVDRFVASRGLETPVTAARIRFPYLGAAMDGPDAVVLMPDLSVELLSWERPAHEQTIDPSTVDRVIDAIARLHAIAWWGFLADHATIPWTPVAERLLLLSRPAATRYADEGNPVGERFLAGWEAFERLATPEARRLVERLSGEVGPLEEALGGLPAIGLHGDLKLANVAAFPDDAVGFIDWQMVTFAPVAVELGWLLVSNSAVLPFEPDDVLRRYRESVAWHVGRMSAAVRLADADEVLGDWAAQVDLAWIVGLLLRGWRKGLDAEASATLASGVSAVDDLAFWCERAVDAAGRRLG